MGEDAGGREEARLGSDDGWVEGSGVEDAGALCMAPVCSGGVRPVISKIFA